MRELKDALSGTGIEAGGRRERIDRGGRAAGRMGDRGDHRRGRAQADARRRRSRRDRRARQQGTLVCAGGLFMRRAAARATVLPVDSEHNALFQAMSGSRREDVRRVILTASGGPFRTCERRGDADATVEQALKHPNWSMGPKVTIDSATLMNKGLELIEAHHLFALLRRRSTSWCIRNRSCTAWSSSATARSSPNWAARTCASRSPIAWLGRSASTGRRRGSISRARRLDLRGAGSGPFPGPGAGPASAGGGRCGADRAQRRERGGGRRIPRAAG